MVDFYESQMKDLEEKIKNEKEREQWQKFADTLKMGYDAAINAGFNADQAWFLVTAALRNSMGG